MYPKIALAAFVLLLSGVNALEAPIKGYNVTTLGWAVEPIRGGLKTILNGTVQEVYNKMLQINPNYEMESGTVAQRAAAYAPLTKRQNWDNGGGDYLCGTFPTANRIDVYDGINYLRGVSGTPTNGPGPGNCGRVSCSYDAAIWWCNDNASDKTLDGYGIIADGAKLVADNCISEWSYDSYTAGQAFNTQNFNVIVRGDSC